MTYRRSYYYSDVLQLMTPSTYICSYNHDTVSKHLHCSMQCICVWVSVVSGPCLYSFISLL